MLELKKITKVYKTGDFVQKALDSVSLTFSETEFTSILGPSGSGKTTLLNIIGGLDKYTSGNLVIDDISTKEYKDADWDAYRNHRIGFVFQSYNLIPHQSILNNVRLALTLSGVSKKEGTKRAASALKSVGLGDHLKKRPAELSGGQMQRVAIARALVNDPDIVLADEPTGALDSETSVQIMEILKEISHRKLVIMVTHNPDLAHQYSTRIINLKDGRIVSDSCEQQIQDSASCAQLRSTQERNTRNGRLAQFGRQNPDERKRTHNTSMSFFTALSLSLNNLLTKKLRTILVAVAGSIGIIGIALILAVSTGFQNYIDKIQEDTMSSYPLTLREEALSLDTLLNFDFINSDLSEDELKDLSEKYDLTEAPILSGAFSTIAVNDLKSFKNYYETHAQDLASAVTSVVYGYGVEPNIYTEDASGTIAKLNPTGLASAMGGGMVNMPGYSEYSSVYTQLNESLSDLNSHYDLLAGRFPTEFDELMITLPSRDYISDVLTYHLGLRDTSELSSLTQTILSGGTISKLNSSDILHLDYSDLLDLDLRLILPPDLYTFNENYNVFEDRSSDPDFLRSVYEEKSLPLKVVGVTVLKEGSVSANLGSNISFSPDLIPWIINHTKDTEVVQRQLENPKKDVFSGNDFDEKASFDYSFEDLVTVDSSALEQAFNIHIDQSEVESEVANQMTEIMNSVSADITPARTRLVELLDKYSDAIYSGIDTTREITLGSAENPYFPLPSPSPNIPADPGSSSSEPITVSVKVLEKSAIPELVDSFLDTYEVGMDFASLETDYKIPAEVYRQAFSGILKSFFEAYISAYNLADPSLTEDPDNPVAQLNDDIYQLAKRAYFQSEPIILVEEQLAVQMTEINSKLAVMEKVMGLTGTISNIFAQSFDIDPGKISSAFHLNFTEDELMRVMNTMLNSSDKSAKTNLISLGYQDLDSPAKIAVYFSSFEGKTAFLDFLEDYNQTVAEEKQIKYSDITGLLMDSVKTIVNAVSYVLIAFVSISLVVSSIMIGIITYISVYERTKEIGILRAIGASKMNITNIFNAETFIIGLLSGLFGIGFTYLIIPITNLILYHATNNPNIAAYLPMHNAGALILLSVFLTLISGLIPARSASKKDPVISLRTE